MTQVSMPAPGLVGVGHGQSPPRGPAPERGNPSGGEDRVRRESGLRRGPPRWGREAGEGGQSARWCSGRPPRVTLQTVRRLARAVRRSQLRWPMSAFCSSVKGEFSRKERASPLLVST